MVPEAHNTENKTLHYRLPCLYSPYSQKEICTENSKGENQRKKNAMKADKSPLTLEFFVNQKKKNKNKKRGGQ